MHDVTVCTGLRWIPTMLNGQPHRLFARDCPRQNECDRYRRGVHACDTSTLASWMDGPEHGEECPHYITNAE